MFSKEELENVKYFTIKMKKTPLLFHPYDLIVIHFKQWWRIPVRIKIPWHYHGDTTGDWVRPSESYKLLEQLESHLNERG